MKIVDRLKRLTKSEMDRSKSTSKKDLVNEAELDVNYYPRDEEPPIKPEIRVAFSPMTLKVLTTLGVLFSLLLFAAGIPSLFGYLYKPQINLEGVGVCSVHWRLMIECFPGVTYVTEAQCHQWDCCWRESNLQYNGVDIPHCYHRVPSSYRFVMAPNNSNLDFPSSPLMLRPFYPLPSLKGFPSDYLSTRIRVQLVSSTRDKIHLRVKLIKGDEEDDSPRKNNEGNNTIDDDALYQVHATSNACANVMVSRKAENRTIFSFNCVGGLVVSSNYTEITIILSPESSVYGLGFTNSPSLLRQENGRAWTLMSNFTDFSSSSSLYGGHPQYLCIEKDGQAHGVVLDSSHVMDVRLLATPALVLRSTSTSFDFHISLGPRPVDVIAQMTSIPGVSKRPALPPYWALGFHLCPMGANVSLVSKVIRDMVSQNIPIDSHCIDSETWQKLVFEQEMDTIVKDKFFTDSIKDLRRLGLKIMAAALPQVAKFKDKSQVDYTFAYQSGREEDIFLPSLHGKFWGNISVAFPDPTNPDTPKWLTKVIQSISKMADVDFDGFIVHWNIPLDLRNHTEDPCKNGQSMIPFERVGNLTDNNFCLDVEYFNNKTHEELYNKYGQLYVSSLRKSVVELKKNQRPMLLSLSSHLSSGHVGGIWGGMFPSSWNGLKQSLIYVQEASIYGIPLSGVPICGHLGVAEIELCGRWMQLGAFNPLALAFYDSTEDERNPLSFNKAFSSFAGQALRLRYSLLPYLYTLFFQSHHHGWPVLRPLFFEFPQYRQTRNQVEPFLWGSGLLFIPCLERGRFSVSVWLPRVCWYEYYSGKQLDLPSGFSNGSLVSVSSPSYYINLFVRGGHVVVTQRGEASLKLTRQSPYVVYIALDCLSEDAEAKGQLVIDDGISMDGPNLVVDIEVVSGRINVNVNLSENVIEHLSGRGISLLVEEVRVYGVKGQVRNVTVDEEEMLKEKSLTDDRFTFNERLGVLVIRQEMRLNESHVIQWT